MIINCELQNHICLQQIPQDPSEGAMKNYAKRKAEEPKKMNSTNKNIVKKSATIENNTEDDKVMNSLFSCPECPFKTISAGMMIQHKYKHSLGKPYKCPYCHVRHFVEELHIAHQKRNHPKLEVIVNKCINSGPGQSEESINSSLWTSEYLSPSCPSKVQQTCKNFQVVPSEQPLTNVSSGDIDSTNAEIIPKTQMSAVQTEVSLQFLELSKSIPSTVPSPGCKNLSALLLEPTATQKTGKRHSVSISHGDENTKRPCLEQSSTSPKINTSRTSSEPTQQKSVIELKRNLRRRR